MSLTPTPRPRAVLVRRAHRFLALNDRVERNLLRARGALHGVVLGLCSDAFLESVDEAYYDGRGEYTDAGYNEQGLWTWELDALERHFEGRRRLLVTGAGGGREVLALAGRGFEPTGFEVHPGLRAFGNRLLEERGHAARLLPCGRTGFPYWEGQAEGVVVGWGSYMLLRGRQRRIAFLRGARRAVPEGAPVLLSFFSRSALGPYLGTVARVGRLVHSRAAVPVEVGDGLDPNYVHYFTKAEVRSELTGAGWDLVDYGTGDYGWAVGRAV